MFGPPTTYLPRLINVVCVGRGCFKSNNALNFSNLYYVCTICSCCVHSIFHLGELLLHCNSMKACQACSGQTLRLMKEREPAATATYHTCPIHLYVATTHLSLVSINIKHHILSPLHCSQFCLKFLVIKQRLNCPLP